MYWANARPLIRGRSGLFGTWRIFRRFVQIWRVNLRRKCSQETLPITYTNTTRISDIEIRRGWPRILNQTWLLATTAMRSCLDWIPWKLIMRYHEHQYSTAARLWSDPNVFSPSVPQHFSHRFGETIGILPSTGIATRKAFCRKLHWVCERLTSDVWILFSWDSWDILRLGSPAVRCVRMCSAESFL